MKVKTLISLFLLISVLFSFTSCELFEIGTLGVVIGSKNGDGYTGGGVLFNPTQRLTTEVHWVETYEEFIEIINVLKEYETDIPDVFLSSYENDAVDAKYCFYFSKSSHKIKKGQEWYERKLSELEILYVGFLDRISIEELEYSSYSKHKSIVFRGVHTKTLDDYQNIIYECNDRRCNIKYRDSINIIGTIPYYNMDDHNEELPKNFHEDFIKSLVYIGD